MLEPKSAPNAILVYNPVNPPQRFVGGLDLQWFGASRYSDVGRDRLGDQLVTVKRFRPHNRCRFSEQRLEYALEDWKEVASHPNILAPLGLLEPNSHSPNCMLVTPHMAGNLLNYTQVNPTVDKGALMYNVAAAIAYMHAQNPPIIHGNIKASNLLVDGEGRVYVSDIGIHEILSPPKHLGYEVRWAAPEKVLKGKPHNTQCDVWSFAMTVLEIQTGQPPFQHYSSEVHVVLAMEKGEIPHRPEGDGRAMNAKIWTLLARCWDYTPSMRPSMREILPQIYSGERS